MSAKGADPACPYSCPRPSRSYLCSAEARRRPSGLKATRADPLSCPGQVMDQVAGRRVPDLHGVVLAAEARCRPSGLNARPCDDVPVSPRGADHWPVVVSQTYGTADVARDERARRARGAEGQPKTSPVSWRVEQSRPVVASQIFTVLSSLAVARRRPSGLNATVWTPSRLA